MLKIKIIIGLALLSLPAFSQDKPDTIFFNKNWKETVKDSALYYRLKVHTGSLYKVEDHYLDGKIQMTGSYSDAGEKIKEGYFTYYHQNEVVSREGLYRNNKEEGEWKTYYTSGKIHVLENFSLGDYNGSLLSYYPDGTKKRQDLYVNGEFSSGECYSPKGKKAEYYPYMEQAYFKGGKENLKKYLQTTLKYPQKAVDQNIQGKVILRFVVGPKGEVTRIKVVQSVHPLLDAEAIRTVSKMPKWIPGKIDGEPVRSYFDLPINFAF